MIDRQGVAAGQRDRRVRHRWRTGRTRVHGGQGRLGEAVSGGVTSVPLKSRAGPVHGPCAAFAGAPAADPVCRCRPGDAISRGRAHVAAADGAARSPGRRWRGAATRAARRYALPEVRWSAGSRTGYLALPSGSRHGPDDRSRVSTTPHPPEWLSSCRPPRRSLLLACRHARRPPGLFAPRTLLSDLCSFEMVFCLLLLQPVRAHSVPELPMDLTVVFSV